MKIKGFSTLYIVIILGSVSLSLSLMLSTSSFLSVKSGSIIKSGFQAKALVGACAEVSLETIREDNNYTGSNSVALGENICNYTISNTGGTNRSIIISGTIGGTISKLQIMTNTFNPINISSWQEMY